MAAHSFGPVGVDVCEPGCGGIWFDWGELAKVDEPDEGLGAQLEAALARAAATPRSEPLRCTRCDARMREHRYQKVRGVLVDECYGCRGFFLDAGELARIRNELGERERQVRAVERLLRDDRVYQEHREEMDVENERTKALAAVSKVFTRLRLGFPSPF
jgi:Zn-finger nucleic acid-binding protein